MTQDKHLTFEASDIRSRWLRPRAFGVACLLVASLILWALGCGGNEENTDRPTGAPDASSSATPLNIPNSSPTEMDLPIRIAVTLPLFEEFAREAGMENVEVISLIPSGADPHSYQFTDQDIERMKGIDFFFLNAAGLDSRLQDVIEANRDDDAYVIPFAPNILSPQGGGQTAEQAGDNPHLWLDPALAYVYTEIVADELVIYDGIRRDTYDANFTAFKKRMLDFSGELGAQLQAVPPDRRKIVSYHNSFAHFARKFDLTVAGYAVEAPGDVPDADSIALLAQTVREQGIPAVFAEFGYDTTVMDRVAAEAGVPVCTLYADIPDTAMSYEEMMRANADEIVRCLGA